MGTAPRHPETGGSVIIGFRRIAILAALITALTSGLSDRALAQEEQSLANQAVNPLGGEFLMVINQYDYIRMEGRFISGPGPGGIPGKNPLAPSHPAINVYTNQPVISAPLKNVIGPGWSFVMRPTFQYNFNSDLPDLTNLGLGKGAPIFPDGPPRPGLPFTTESGFGDPNGFALIGKTIPTTFLGGGAFVVGAGMAGSLPWGDDRFTNDKYTLGPAGTAIYLGKPGVFGALLQQFYDVANNRSNGSAPKVSKMLAQVPYYLNLTEQWQLGGAPVWTLDWENDSYEIPPGLGLAYTGPVLKGLPPMKIGFEMQTYADQDALYGGDWGVKVFVNPILPTPIRGLFPGLY